MSSFDRANQVRRALAGRSDVRLAMLFGSQARGTARPDSDVDLAIDAPDAAPLELMAPLSVALGCEVDVVVLEDAGQPLLEAIPRDGVVVHESRRGAGAAWRANVLTT